MIPFSKEKKKKGFFEKVTTTQKTVPYLNAYSTGIIESDKNLYTKCYCLEDVNFRTAQDSVQLNIFEKYQKFLNLFSANNRIQIIINNFKRKPGRERGKPYFQAFDVQ